MENPKTTQTQQTKEEPTRRSVSIPLPRLSVPGFQSVILVLLILVGLLQTVQLFGLQDYIASAKVSSSSATTTAPAAPSGGTSGSSGTALPDMVGGC